MEKISALCILHPQLAPTWLHLKFKAKSFRKKNKLTHQWFFNLSMNGCDRYLAVNRLGFEKTIIPASPLGKLLLSFGNFFFAEIQSN